jgi:hypothetical protein
LVLESAAERIFTRIHADGGTEQQTMPLKLKWVMFSGACVFAAAAVLALPPVSRSSVQAPVQSSQAQPAVRIPSYNSAPPTKPLPDTLSPTEFSDPLTKNAYAMAAKVKNVLYQQPCFCYCDQNDGHHSLYDCFVTAHASGCNICRYEAILAYEETRKGVSAAQIRKEIIRGDWKKIDPNAYSTVKDIR